MLGGGIISISVTTTNILIILGGHNYFSMTIACMISTENDNMY